MNKLLYVTRHAAIMAILLATVFAHAQVSNPPAQSTGSGEQHRLSIHTPAAPAKDLSVTPVTGESWIRHLNRQLGDTSMGKTGRLGPAPAAPGGQLAQGEPRNLASCTAQNAALHGADLYRLNCRGCHGEAGKGAPPEINSVIDPVRATSVPLVLERMKKMGMSMSRAEAEQLAHQAQVALLERLHNGGQNMPPFPQLNESEIRSIIAYLRQLAGIPGAEKEQVAVSETPLRVGELIVKSTCHTCHDASGPNPSPQQLLDGTIPPLETLTARKDQSGLVQKVTQGAPIIMGTPPAPTRGRMPVFYYLSDEEATDVHLYLTANRPSEFSVLDSVAATLQPPQTSVRPDPGKTAPKAQIAPGNSPADLPQSISRAEPPYLVLFAGMGLFAAMLMAGGLGFTLWTFKRLSPKPARPLLVTTSSGLLPSASQPVVTMKRGPCRAVSVRDKGRRYEQPFTDEVGDRAGKNNRGGRQCNGARIG